MGVGLAKNHWGIPSSSLRVEALYCTPVLLSGLAPLLIIPAEMETLAVYQRKILRQILKLPKSTAAPAIYFLAGALPVEAQIHLRQLGLLLMVTHFPATNPLRQVALFSLQNPSKYSWFTHICSISEQYGLPEPMQLFADPPPRLATREWPRKQSSNTGLTPSTRLV